MKHFVGLDVSMKETAVCVVDEAGQRIWEGSVRSSADTIAAIIREKAPHLVRAYMETGPQAVWLWHALRQCGIAVDCIHARRAAAALKLKANKTDRNDTFGLARLVHSGWYEPVAIKAFDRYRMRAVLTARERIVRMCTTMINQIRGLAKTFGLTLSARKGQVFEQSVRQAIPDDAVLRDLFDHMQKRAGYIWFSYRGGLGDGYRICYATQPINKDWELKLQGIGIIAPSFGWNSGLIEHPFFSRHGDRRYMLHNGNDFGNSGIGLAIREEIR